MAKRVVEFDIIATDKASKTVASADASLAKLDKSVASTSKSLTTHGTALDAVKGKMSGLANQIPGGSKALDMLGGSAEGAGGSLAALAGPAALGAVAAIGAKTVGMVQDLAQEVLRFQRVAGTSAEESSKFVEVMSDYGVSAEQGANAIGKFAKNVATAPQAFADLGVQIVKTKDGSVDLEATLMKAADVFSTTTDETKRAELGTKLFGKSWQDMIPILDKGSAGIKKAFDNVDSGKIFTQQQINNSEDLRLAVDDLRDKGESLALTIGKSLVPALKDLATEGAAVAEVFDNKVVTSIIHFLAKASLVPGAMAFIESQSSNAGAAVLNYAEALGGPLHAATNNVSKAQIDAAETTQVLTEKAKALAEADKNATKAYAELEKGVRDATKAEKDLLKAGEDLYVSQHNDLPAAIDALNGKLLDYYDAVKNAKDETKKHGEASAEAQRASIALNGASRDLVGGIDAVAKAASDSLGPNATALEQYSAQKDALQKLKDRFPELATQIDLYTQGALDRYTAATHDAAGATRDIGTAAGETQTAVELAADAAARAWSTASGQIQASADAMERSAGSAQRAADAGAGSVPGGPGDVAPSSSGGRVNVRAAGGPVSAGSPYLVGEVGPEMFVPRTAGMIVPNNQLGGGGVTIIVQGSVIDSKGVIDALATGKRLHPSAFAQVVA